MREEYFIQVMKLVMHDLLWKEKKVKKTKTLLKQEEMLSPD